MPFFKWNGITIEGTKCGGVLFALSQDELDALLFKQQIALVQSTEKATWFVRSINQVNKIQFFRELSLLLNSGILLPDALHILAAQLTHPTLQEVTQQLHIQVAKGVLLHDAMQDYPDIFDQFMIQMVHVGHENGNLAQSLALLSDHLETRHNFHKTLRALSLAPLSTFLFFLLILLLIFVFIVPQFASLFANAGKELPLSTRIMLSIAEWMQSLYMPIVVLGIVLSGLLLYRWFKRPTARRVKTRLLFSLPLVGSLVKYNSAAQFFQALSLLLDGGMHLVPALTITRESCNNIVLVDVIEALEHDIKAGSSLSQALFYSNSSLFEPEVILMISIGQESGHVSHVLQRAAYTYQQKVHRIFSFISTFFQPMLLVILGLLVAALVFSVYIPLFNLSHVIPS